MARLTIKNIGPVSSVKMNLRAVNVLMGPQGCGKSTIAKIISFCCWLEKDCLIHLSTEYVDKEYVNSHLIEFYRMKSYFWRDSFIDYEGTAISFRYEKGNVSVNKTERFLESAVGKVSYIPAERNVILLPNIGQIPLNMDYLQSYIFDWLALRGRFDGENAIGLLDMDAEYYYDDTQKRDLIRLDGRNNIFLTEASSGIQSATPLYASMKYLTDVIYRIKESVSFERQRLIESSVNSVQADVINSIQKEQEAKEKQELSNGLGLYNIIDGSAIDARLEAIKDNISRTHFARVIMEEPELSIFPRSQVAMVRDFLMMLDTERDMLVLTTHSPYVLYALNNFMLGWLAKENMEEEGEDRLLAQADAFVDPKSVSVWEIKDGQFLPDKNSENGTIQDANGLIRGNYFDRVMKEVMGDFSAFLGYYE